MLAILLDERGAFEGRERGVWGFSGHNLGHLDLQKKTAKRLLLHYARVLPAYTIQQKRPLRFKSSSKLR